MCYFDLQIFGDMTAPGMDKDVKNALEKGAKGVENLLGSQVSLNRVRGRRPANMKAGFQDPPTPPEVSNSDSDSVKEIKKKK